MNFTEDQDPYKAINVGKEANGTKF